LTVRNAAGDVLYQWHRSGTPPGDALQLQSIEPIRAMVESIPGAATPKTFGELRVVVTQAVPPTSGAGLMERMTSVSRDHLRTALLLAAGLALIGGLAGAALAWRAGRKLEQPITALIRSADRIGQGDYTRPLDVARRDELGELQQALERM